MPVERIIRAGPSWADEWSRATRSWSNRPCCRWRSNVAGNNRYSAHHFFAAASANAASSTVTTTARIVKQVIWAKLTWPAIAAVLPLSQSV